MRLLRQPPLWLAGGPLFCKTTARSPSDLTWNCRSSPPFGGSDFQKITPTCDDGDGGDDDFDTTPHSHFHRHIVTIVTQLTKEVSD